METQGNRRDNAIKPHSPASSAETAVHHRSPILGRSQGGMGMADFAGREGAGLCALLGMMYEDDPTQTI